MPDAPVPPRRRPDLPTLLLTVVEAHDLIPGLRRVILTAPDAAPLAYKPGQDLVFMLPMPDGELGRRHYTIRAQDPATGHIAVDFVMHGDSPGPRFARDARPGDRVEARGPRGNTWLRPGAGWHLFAGDETALPGILHMLETLPEGASAHALIEVQGPDWELPVPQGPGITVEWLLRGTAPPGPNTLLLDRVEALALPDGDGVAYLIAETSKVRAMRHHLIARGLTREQIVSEGYWRPGRLGGHDHVSD